MSAAPEADRPPAATGGGWRSPATALMAAAMLVSGGMLIALGARLSFLLDDWVFIMYRRGNPVDDYLLPDNEHFVAGATAVWKALLNTFGLGSTVPYRVVSTAMFLLGAWFMFVWIRRRVGEWAALFAAVLVLFLGAAFEDLLWFASITFLGSMAGGMGMLVALDRRDRRGDVLACVALTVSLLFSSLWLAFAAGAVVDIWLRRGERLWWRRLYVVAVPLALYAIWWLGWGHTAHSAASLHNLIGTPLYVAKSYGSAVAAVLGLASPAQGVATGGLSWAKPVAIGIAAAIALALAALAAWRVHRLGRVPRSFWVVAAVGLAFWVLGGLDVKPGRVAWASRYQYPSGVFFLLMAAGMLEGVRLSRRLLAPALVVASFAVLSNLVMLRDSYQGYRATSQIERADLAAVEIARDTVEPGFVLDESIADTGYVHVEAAPFLGARDAYGSPAYSLSELAGAPEAARIPADKVLAAALRLELAPVDGRPPLDPASCRELRAAASPAVVQLPPGGVYLRAAAPGIEAALERYSESFPVALGTLDAGTWTSLAVPADRSPRPWRLRLSGSGRVSLCG